MEIIPFTIAFVAITSRWVNINAFPLACGCCTDDWVTTTCGALLGYLKNVGWSPKGVYYHCWPPISSTRPLTFPIYRTIFLQMPYSSTIITSLFLRAVSEMVYLTLLTLRGLCDSGWDENVVYALWKVFLFLNHDPLPLIYSPLRKAASNPDLLLLVDLGATDLDGPWFRGCFGTDSPFTQSSQLSCISISTSRVFLQFEDNFSIIGESTYP